MPDLIKEINIKMKRKSNSEINRLTREAITTALLKLLKCQQLDQISISSIVQLAGVSRTAYYNNYHSKIEVLNDLIDNFINDINTSLQPHNAKTSGKLNQPYQFIYTLFKTVYQHRTLYKILINANLSHQILKQLNILMVLYLPAETDNEKYNVYFQAGAIFNVLTLWIENGAKGSCEHMAQLFSQQYGNVN